MKKRAKKLVMVITPKPPICISSMMTICPSTVNVVGTSIVVKPVTQTALVAVNSESIHDKCTPCWTQRGISRRPEPTSMMNRKLTAIIKAGFDFLPSELIIASERSMTDITNNTNKWKTRLSRTLITPVLSSIPSTLTMIGNSVSARSALTPHPQKLYADFFSIR